MPLSTKQYKEATEMNVGAFGIAREQYARAIPFQDPDEYNRVWQALKKAAAPEHVCTYSGIHSADSLRCSCGWESVTYWDLIEAAWGDWREHVADEMGLIPKTCPCGKQYLPAQGESACHQLRPVGQ